MLSLSLLLRLFEQSSNMRRFSFATCRRCVVICPRPPGKVKGKIEVKDEAAEAAVLRQGVFHVVSFVALAFVRAVFKYASICSSLCVVL